MKSWPCLPLLVVLLGAGRNATADDSDDSRRGFVPLSRLRSTEATDEKNDDEPIVVFSLRSVAAIAFLPIGGAALKGDRDPSTSGQAGLYALGAAADGLNLWSGSTRVSLANLSVYLLGVNFAGIGEETRWVNLAYVRFGPHVLFGSERPVGTMKGRNGWLGFQLGYGGILTGDTFQARTTILHGVDLAFTVTWNDHPDDDERKKK